MESINEQLSKLDKWVSEHNPGKELLSELVVLKEKVQSADINTKHAALEEINDRFYKDLEFGTSGIRGIMGAGSNRLNVHTVINATKGVAKYINANYENPSAAIGYDSRHNSELFAKTTAEEFLAHGIDVFLYDTLMPVPALSFAIRYHQCTVGVMITASHNYYTYNGYKVYDEHGCQITDNVTSEILKNMTDVAEQMQQSEAMQQIETDQQRESSVNQSYRNNAKLTYMGEETKNAFYEAVLAQKIAYDSELAMQEDLANLSIVFTPLNGTGNIPTREVLNKIGAKSIHVVKEQELPDGNFPTCPHPNPAKKEALEKGLELLKKVNADLLVATDPDCDRVVIAENANEQEYTFSGDETGILLFDFICNIKSKTNVMPKTPVAARTFVSSKMFDAIAKEHGIDVKVTPTGFKYIGEFITELEAQERASDYIFGFEETNGYLYGTHTRDKDAVSSAMLICQMAAYYKKQGKTLIGRLAELYEKYGYFLEKQLEFTFEGEKGAQKMAKIMQAFKESSISGVADNEGEAMPLEVANVIELAFENAGRVVIRPSGTEPTLKIYLSAKGNSRENVSLELEKMAASITSKIKQF